MQLHYYRSMNPNEEESSLTDRYQTTVPSRIRKALGLRKKDKLKWFIDESGGILVQKARAEDTHSDPVLDSWLDFLEKDILDHPERLVSLDDRGYKDLLLRLSSDGTSRMPDLPATLNEFLAQSHIEAIKEDE